MLIRNYLANTMHFNFKYNLNNILGLMVFSCVNIVIFYIMLLISINDFIKLYDNILYNRKEIHNLKL